MQTHDLVHKLSSDLTPRPHRSIVNSILVFFVSTLASLAIGILILEPYPGFIEKMSSARFIAENLGIFTTFLMSGIGALLLSVPGRLRTEKYLPLLAFSLALWLGTLTAFGVSQALNNEHLGFDLGYACTFAILGLAILPSALLFSLVRRQAPTRLGSNAFAAATAAFSAGSLALQVHCPIDAVAHHFMWHGLPVLAFASLAAFWSSKLLKW